MEKDKKGGLRDKMTEKQEIKEKLIKHLENMDMFFKQQREKLLKNKRDLEELEKNLESLRDTI